MEIAVAASPVDVAFDAAAGRAYVLCQAAATVVVVDVTGPSVIGSFATVLDPCSIAHSPLAGALYVTGFTTSTVQLLDAGTGEIRATATAGTNPYAVAVDADGSRLYVADDGDSTLSVLDGQTGVSLTSLPVGGQPAGVAVVAPGTVAVVSRGDDVVRLVNSLSGQVTQAVSLPAGSGAAGIAADPTRRRICVACADAGAVVTLDPSGTMIGTTALAGSPVAVAADPGSALVVVADSSDKQLVVVDPEDGSIVARIPVGNGPSGVAVAGQIALVANSSDATLSIVSLPGAGGSAVP